MQDIRLPESSTVMARTIGQQCLAGALGLMQVIETRLGEELFFMGDSGTN